MGNGTVSKTDWARPDQALRHEQKHSTTNQHTAKRGGEKHTEYKEKLKYRRWAVSCQNRETMIDMDITAITFITLARQSCASPKTPPFESYCYT
jgi:hypothetical protein